MSEQWITARAALEIVGSRFTLCTRLHRGLVVARAASFHIDDKACGQRVVPKEFWWAGGHEALNQDWDAGDFSTWIDHKRHLEAFGVSIALEGLLELVEVERRPLIARSLSVAADPGWVTAQEALQIANDLLGTHTTRPAALIKDQAGFGFVVAKAVAAQGINISDLARDMVWAEREWNIPAWFWTVMAVNEPTDEDWEAGKFGVSGLTPNGSQTIMLRGVHFHRESLLPIFGRRQEVQQKEFSAPVRGRKKEYDWEAAANGVWGLIYRGELIPNNQADVEKAFIKALTKGDKEPSESTVRPYARRVWEEFNK
jgi:hypothetical protein